ncbi:MAG: DUF1792 domain-containing protein [Flavobacteriales bacterium]|nr:DUF1792 domain-containing protein [Flavobacteriales bacterium]
MKLKLYYLFIVNLIFYSLERFFFKIRWIFNYPSDEKVMDSLHYYAKLYPKMESIEDTIEEIVNNRKSISRFGDGEYSLVLYRNISFQTKSLSLAFRMFEILKEKSNPNCLVGIIVPVLNQGPLGQYSLRYLYENNIHILRMFTNKKYYSARISREMTKESVVKLQNAWLNRNVIFVSGKNSRFDVNHKIFDGVKAKVSIWTLPVNAWSEYQKVLNEVISESKKIDDPLVICSIGPTATVMAYDLSSIGIQCLDLGHITNCYDRVFENAAKPEDLSLEIK